MTQPNQTTPTLQANIAGTSTTVNLRDWLNTRLSPFLKKAIIESLDSEAEYPLQWLGEHLIQQSILFEGNPDTTNIQERFRYKHEAKPPATLVRNADPPQTSSAQQQPAPSPQIIETVNHVASTPELQPVQIQPATAPSASVVTSTIEPASEPVPSATATPAPVVNVNGTTDGTPAPVQDTEMSNAP